MQHQNNQEVKAAEIGQLREALSATQPARDDGWLQDRGLLYRLTDDRRPHNRDEIRVMMVDGSRSDEACSRRAGELLDRIRATQPAQAAQGEPVQGALDGWHIAITGADEVVVRSPADGPGGMTIPAGQEGSLPVRLLSAVCRAVLDTYPTTPPQPAAGADVPDMVEIMALADSYRNATCPEATANAREWLRAAIAASGRKS